MYAVQELQSYENFGGSYEKTNTDIDRFADRRHIDLCRFAVGVCNAEP
jgi:hypothetical protein